MIRNIIFSIFFFLGIITISLFFLPAFFLPKKIYEDSAKLYAFCRVLDDIADEKIDLDIQFIDNYTLYNYFQILLKTPIAMVIRFYKNKSSIIK